MNIKRHDNDTIEAVFNCDDCYFVTGSSDKTCKIWQRDPYDVWQAQGNAKQKTETSEEKDELTNELTKMSLENADNFGPGCA